MCNKYNETVNHLFITCDTAQKICERYDRWIVNILLKTSFYSEHFLSIHFMCLNKKSIVVWKGLWVAIVWEIWK